MCQKLTPDMLRTFSFSLCACICVRAAFDKNVKCHSLFYKLFTKAKSFGKYFCVYKNKKTLLKIEDNLESAK